MKSMDQQVRLTEGQLSQIRRYSEVTGMPVQQCVDEALEDWFNTVVAARVSQLEKQNVLEFPVRKTD